MLWQGNTTLIQVVQKSADAQANEVQVNRWMLDNKEDSAQQVPNLPLSESS